MNYECHITIKNNSENHEEWKAIANNYGWKTSFIIGDPLLPDQTGYFYFTCHNSNIERMFTRMRQLSNILGSLVVREKIELVIYDTGKKLIL